MSLLLAGPTWAGKNNNTKGKKMSYEIEYVIRVLATGIGATIVMDLWALFLRRCFTIPSLNYAMVARWIGHFHHGKFQHENIAKAQAVYAENVLGWGLHYLTGIVFSAVLLGLYGLEWFRNPSLFPAIIFGIATVIVPFFILQPGLGAGIAASKTPQPHIARLRSLAAHAVFGLGLYLSARLLALIMA
jgi:hypothetical protein